MIKLQTRRRIRERVRSSDDKANGYVLEVSNLTAGYGTDRVVNGINLRQRAGSVVTLLGPSGCGKTTTLRCVAGLHTPSGGEIVIGGKTCDDMKRHIPPDQRPVNMVFQSYALWPHMTVFDNVAYGLRAAGGLSRKAIREEVGRMLEIVGLGGFESRYSTSLSGGQQQRVVLARALVTKPELLLLDEPLSNLDTELRTRLRTELLALHSEFELSMLYVTHDRTEALALSDEIVVLGDGVAQQHGTPGELYDYPRSRYVAEALGSVNVFRGKVTGPDEMTTAVLMDCESKYRVNLRTSDGDSHMPVGGDASVMIRPEWIRLREETEELSGIRGTVRLVQYLGNRTSVVCRSGGTEFEAELSGLPEWLRPGAKIVADVVGNVGMRGLPWEPGAPGNE